MHNIRLVTKHLHAWAQQNYCDYRFLELSLTKDGQDHFLDAHRNGWRMYHHIDHAQTLEELHSTPQARELGYMLGLFHRVMTDVDHRLLQEVLPDLHNSQKYLEQYDRIIARWTPSGRRETACVEAIKRYRQLAANFAAAGDAFTCQVVHGDPKVSNFLFTQRLDRVISLIDLDTVQAGLLLHDLGDGLRSCCNQAGEEQCDPASTHFSVPAFRWFLEGYGQIAAPLLGAADRQWLPMAPLVISFELGVRFFIDYLSGNRYFKTTRKGHNLDRALVQFSLTDSIEAQQGPLQAAVSALFPITGDERD